MLRFPPFHFSLRPFLCLLCALGLALASTAAEIDWEKARALNQRSQRGEQLSADEQRYLEEAKAARRAGQNPGPAPSDIDMARARELFARSQRGESLTAEEQAYLDKAKASRARGNATQADIPPPRSETGLVPLTDLTTTYQDHDGGLYGGGRNGPPEPLAKAAKAVTAKIQPLDSEGKPAAGGRIVLLSVGMSNTTQEFSRFIQLAQADPDKSPTLVLVDGAQGGQTAARIADESVPFWSVINQRLKAAGVTPQQVQVIWLKEANAGPKAGFPAETQKLQADIAADILIARKRYENLQLVYLSSRIYAGYATTPLNPEPYAYEGAFAVRGVIQDQLKPGPNSTTAELKPPLLLWGPYLWADGLKGRQAGDLVWKREDFGGDGTHPSETGREKVARQLLKFFKEDPNTSTWFVRH